MRPLWAVGLYLLCVFLGGAVVVPWVYKCFQALVQAFPSLHSLFGKPFPRYLSRCFMILAIAGIWPLLRRVDLASWRALGLSRRPDSRDQLLYGFLVGLVSLALVVAIVLASGARVPETKLTLGAVLGRCGKAALTAIFVAPIEEFFFRGVLFGALKKTFHWTLALVLSSVVYGMLHFLDRATPVEHVVWYSGIEVLPRMAAGICDPARLMPGLLNLTLVGIILGLAYERTGTLYFSIGLHAGWIFWLRTYGAVTEAGNGSLAWFFGTGKLINGWLAFVVLGALLTVLSRMLVQDDPHAGWKERRLFS